MTTRSVCPVCQQTDVTMLRTGCIYVRHMDFQPMQHQPEGLARCSICEAVFMSDEDTVAEIRNIYSGTDYAREKKTEHRVHDEKTDGSDRTTYRAIAEFLAGSYPNRGPRILDIGCFDGKLLQALEENCTGAEMHGYDVSPAIADRFPHQENYIFHCSGLAGIDGTFDLICIVNTLMYIENPADFMCEIDRLLKPGALLFVLTPNTAANPCFLTLGDQMLYFSPLNLGKFLARFGYECELETGNGAFPRSILATARRAETATDDSSSDTTFEASACWLLENTARIGREIDALRRTAENGRIAILGTTHNAAWALQAAGGDIDCFVDENPARTGTEFYGRPVLHPREMENCDVILIPYGKTADTLGRKFDLRYSGRTVTI